jgi:magnesium and cobalt transporter
VFIPESKPVDVLLKDFRMKRNHMALVVDEFGSVSGLITIEDVLEEIVGEIDDEYDIDETAGNIVAAGENKWRVKAGTSIEDFNEFFGTHFADDDYDTLGGLVSDEMEHVPHTGEVIELEGLRIRVIKAAARRAQLFLVEKAAADGRVSEGESKA